MTNRFDKGQATIEIMVILAISSVVLMVVISASQERLSAEQGIYEETQIKSSLRKLTAGADFVYSQSLGASMEVYVTIPTRIQALNVTGHCFVYDIIRPDGGTSESGECTLARLSGSINDTPGSKYIVLTNEGEHVSVKMRGEAGAS